MAESRDRDDGPVARAAGEAIGDIWPNGLGFCLDTDTGQWEFYRRADGGWCARYFAPGECLPFLVGIGPTWRAAGDAAELTEWAGRPGDAAHARAALTAWGRL